MESWVYVYTDSIVSHLDAFSFIAGSIFKIKRMGEIMVIK